MIMNKQLFLFILVLLPMVASAEAIEIDGIYYNLETETKTAEVTRNPNKYTKDVVIPSTITYDEVEYSVTSIGRRAFYCSGMTSVTIPNSLTSIGREAFYNCSCLTSITIPSSVKSIESGAFNLCEGLTSVSISDIVAWCNITFGNLFSNPLYYAHHLFINGEEVKDLVFPNNMKSIGNYAFDSCGGLTSVTIPNSVTTIGEYAFYNCSGLASVSIGKNVTDIGQKAFYISNVRDIYIYTVEVPNTGNDVFSDHLMSKITLHIPYGTSSLYKKTSPWSKLNIVPQDTLIAKVSNSTREYGEENPVFNIKYSGFIGNDNENVLSVTPSVSTTATKKSDVGEYPIKISGGSSENYVIVYESGVLTITKAPLTAKVNNETRQYGEENPTFTVNYSGLKNGEIIPKWTKDLIVETSASKQSDVGTYAITATGVPTNYDLPNIENGTLTITQVPLTIKANDASRQYYSDNPTFSYSCSGFVNGEDKSVLTLEPTLSTSATLSSNVGTYDIEVNGASSTNYSISYANGTLTITPRTLTASVGNYERLYNEENPVFEVKYDGFVGNEDEKMLSTQAIASTSATKTSDVGTYSINVTGGSADNYIFSYTSGTLTINKAEQTITWEQDLSNLKVGDQVELQAVSSSGLPISYSMDNNNAAEIYSAGNNKKYLDCKAEGQFTIRAIQEGNKNYYSTTRIYKTVIIGNGESAIRSIENSLVKIQVIDYGIKVSDANAGDVIRVYSTNGVLLKSVKAEGQITDIPLSKDKVYIVKVGGKTVKLSL